MKPFVGLAVALLLCSSACNRKTGGGDGGIPVDDGGTPFGVVRLEISPQNATVEVLAGQQSPAQGFTVKGFNDNAEEVLVPAGFWSFDRIDAAEMNATTAIATPTGFAGGTGNVKVTIGTLSATTPFTVKLKTSAGTTPPGTTETTWSSATETDPSLALIYPYDATVFPRGLQPPVLQWNAGGATNSYRIEITSAAFSFIGYDSGLDVVEDLRPGYALPKLNSTPGQVDIWTKLCDATSGEVSVKIQRYDGTKAFLPKTMTWKIAPVSLKGLVYYSQLKRGATTLFRIPPGGNAETFIKNEQLATMGDNCVACHSANSADGRHLVMSYNGGRSPWAVFNAETGDLEYKSDAASGFQAISPNGQYVLWGHWNDDMLSYGHLTLSAANSGSNLAPASLAELSLGAGISPVQPVWSPNGNLIALGGTSDTGNLLEYTSSSLYLVDANLAAMPNAFTNPRLISTGSAPFTAATYPSFSPDSTWVAFMKANRIRTGSDGVTAPAAKDSVGQIWLASTNGTTQTMLRNLNTVPGGADDRNFAPSFYPLSVGGGYNWLAFVGRRPYGHRTFSIDNSPDYFYRQIWIAAVDPNPSGTTDPSHPAFYLEGQLSTATNERPVFARNPCKMLGQSCEAGFDCCDGYCRQGGDAGTPVCQTKPESCSQANEACGTSADCCDGLQCIGGYCQDQLIQ